MRIPLTKDGIFVQSLIWNSFLNFFVDNYRIALPGLQGCTYYGQSRNLESCSLTIQIFFRLLIMQI